MHKQKDYKLVCRHKNIGNLGEWDYGYIFTPFNKDRDKYFF